jgi:hypothetical protein
MRGRDSLARAKTKGTRPVKYAKVVQLYTNM